MSIRNVLLVSKRAPELCATKALFNSAGVNVSTATNLPTAAAVGSALAFQAIIVCRGSFGEPLQKEFVHDLKEARPDVEIILGCPGCTTCHDPEAPIGILIDPEPIESILPKKPKG